MFLKAIYSTIYILLSPFFLIHLRKKLLSRPSEKKRWKEYLGVTPAPQNQNSIWIHAVSVGESIAAIAVIKALKAKNKNIPIVVTTTTPTGAEQIQKLGDSVEHRYMPLDLSWSVKKFIDTIKPAQLLIMETELWPNTLHTVSSAGIPITIVNARLSEKSKQNYLKVHSLFKTLESSITKILCQTEEDSIRFSELGVKPDKFYTVGSIKFDITIPEETISQGDQLRNKLNSKHVWIASSTHEGEDHILLDAHKIIRKKIPESKLILVPRHPERFPSVYQLCQEQEFNTLKRTTSRNASLSECDVYLGDTMGEMLILIQASDICFMGGSLLGDKVGGHNVLEPAALGKPIITGPSYYNFLDITERLKSLGVVQVATTNNEIANAVVEYYSSKEQSEKISNASLRYIDSNRGAIEKTIKHILEY